MFVLPVIIFGLLFKTAVKLGYRSTHVILIILASVCCFNFMATLLSYCVGSWIYHFDLSLILPHDSQGLQPAWTLALSPWIGNDKVLLGGIITGLLSSWLQPQRAELFARYAENVISVLLKIISCILPVFVLGFVIKLQHDGALARLLFDYTGIFMIILCAQIAYLLMLYAIANKGAVSAMIRSIKNMLPAALTGLTTMSSAAAMPLTIVGAEKNATNKDLARAVIPATVNIHLVGDCFAIPIFAYAILKSFGVAEPSFFMYVIFACYFVMAKFSVAAIPGGGILVMLPILEKYLGFNAEMMSLITALYILFDPIITSVNVLGNGAFAQIMDKIASTIKK